MKSAFILVALFPLVCLASNRYDCRVFEKTVRKDQGLVRHLGTFKKNKKGATTSSRNDSYSIVVTALKGKLKVIVKNRREVILKHSSKVSVRADGTFAPIKMQGKRSGVSGICSYIRPLAKGMSYKAISRGSLRCSGKFGRRGVVLSINARGEAYYSKFTYRANIMLQGKELEELSKHEVRVGLVKQKLKDQDGILQERCWVQADTLENDSKRPLSPFTLNIPSKYKGAIPGVVTFSSKLQMAELKGIVKDSELELSCYPNYEIRNALSDCL